MRFAIVNDLHSHRPVEWISESSEDLYNWQLVSGSPEGWSILPIMTLDEYHAEGSDFRLLLGGRPAVSYFELGNAGEVVQYVYLIESWEAFEPVTGKSYNELMRTDWHNMNV